MSLAPDDPRHGTANGYCNLKCRCPACTDAWRIYYASRRNGPAINARIGNNYRIARNAGYSNKEATRRMHWSDPLRKEK